MAYEKYIAELERKLNAEQAILKLRTSKVDETRKEVFRFESSIKKYKQKQEAAVLIEAMELPHRVMSLAQLTVERIDEAASLKKTRMDRSNYFGLSTLVKCGKLPGYLNRYSPVGKAKWIMHRANNLIQNDTSKKGAMLVESVRVRSAEIHEEWMNEAA